MMEQGKMYKKTTSEQFDILSQEMGKNVHLARGAPVFGGSRAQFEQKWEEVALKLNSAGPPHRSTSEWKKVWTDMRNRTKKSISKNNNLLRETGGGAFMQSTLTPLEQEVDKIMNLSTSAAPSGVDFGVGPLHADQLQSSASPSITKSSIPAKPSTAIRNRKRKRDELLEQQIENEKALLEIMKTQVELSGKMVAAIERQAIASENLCKVIEARGQTILPF